MKHLILFLLLISTAQADLVLNAGAGSSILGIKGPAPFERVGKIGWQFGDSAFIRPEFGYFMSGGYGESSGFFSLLFGVKAKATTGTMLSLAVGPTDLLNPDNQLLSGHFQNQIEGCVGIEMDFYLGACYTHLSNAGIVQPNRGRDFLMLQLRFNKL